MVMDEQLGCISISAGSVVCANSAGDVLRYKVKADCNGMPDPDGREVSVDSLQVSGGGIVSLSMDAMNLEGLVGTQDGSIFYVSFKEN